MKFDQKNIDASKRWMDKIINELDKDEFFSERVVFDDVMTMVAPFKVDIRSAEEDYETKWTHKERTDFIMGLAWPWMETKKEPEKAKDEELTMSTEVTCSAAALKAMGVVHETHVMFKVLQHLHGLSPDITHDRVRELFTQYLAATADFDGSNPIGAPKIISTNDYMAWKQTQTGKCVKVGPATLWTLLEMAGVSVTSGHNDSEGRDYLVYERNGKKLILYDRFMVHSNFAEHVRASPDEVNAFLDRFKHKGAYIKYCHITVEAYEVALAYSTLFAIKGEGDIMTSKLMDTNLKDNPYRLPMFSKKVMDIFDKISQGIASNAVTGKGKMQLFDSLARWIDRMPEEDRLYVATSIRSRVKSAASSYLGALTEAMAKSKNLPPADRMLALKKATSAPDMPADAVKRLDHARELRNPGMCDVVNHNVGSVRANNLVEWADTYFKGEAMVDEALRLAIAKDRTVDTKTIVYGIAYGHMVPCFNRLRVAGADASNLIFVDNCKAKGSTEVFQRGDVFAHSEMGAWVFDDSNSHKVPADKKVAFKDYTGDHYKVRKFINAEAPYFVTKVHLSSFSTQEHRRLWTSILEASSYGIRLVKYGRLHNAEIFMIGQRGKGYNDKGLTGDLRNISLCVSIANDVIMQFQQSGLRAGHWAYPEDQSDPICLSAFWRNFIRCLPVQWPWYTRKTIIEYRALATIQETEDFDDSRTEYVNWDGNLDEAGDFGFEGAMAQLEKPKEAPTLPDPPPLKCYDKLEIKAKSLDPADQYPNYGEPMMQGLDFNIKSGPISVGPDSSLGFGASNWLITWIKKGDVDYVFWDPEHVCFQPSDDEGNHISVIPLPDHVKKGKK